MRFQDVAQASAEPIPRDDVQSARMVAKAGDGRRDRRSVDGEALVRLDRVQAVREAGTSCGVATSETTSIQDDLPRPIPNIPTTLTVPAARLSDPVVPSRQFNRLERTEFDGTILRA